MQLGRDLGQLDPEAGSVISAKVLTGSCIIVRHIKYRLLEETELESHEVL
jgi:hypothetical protein